MVLDGLLPCIMLNPLSRKFGKLVRSSMSSCDSLELYQHIVGPGDNYSHFLVEFQWYKTQSKKKGERLLVPASPAKPASASKPRKSGESYLEGCEFVVIGKLSLTQVSFVHG